MRRNCGPPARLPKEDHSQLLGSSPADFRGKVGIRASPDEAVEVILKKSVNLSFLQMTRLVLDRRVSTQQTSLRHGSRPEFLGSFGELELPILSRAVLAHKLGFRTSSNPEVSWNLRNWPEGFVEGEENRLIIACGGRWIGYFRLAPYALFNRADTQLFQAMMAGEHYIRGLFNADIRKRLEDSPHLRDLAHHPKRMIAKVSRILNRFHTHKLIAKIPRTRRWRVTDRGRCIMAASLCLRDFAFPQLYRNENAA